MPKKKKDTSLLLPGQRKGSKLNRGWGGTTAQCPSLLPWNISTESMVRA